MTKIKEVADLPGVGEKTAEKLKESGFIDMMAVAAASSTELANAANIGDATAAKIIEAAREILNLGFETATKVYEKRQKMGIISTGSRNLNNLLGGGIRTGTITELHGAFGSGKSQVGFQSAVNVQLPPEKGGLNGNCIFIDVENTFSPGRIRSIAEAAGLDPDQALENILVARAYNSDHQVILTEKSSELIKDNNVKLLIVDSVTSAFRSDFSGRGELAPRQQKLNRHLHTLQRIADIHNVAIYITNQVMTNPGLLFGDPTTPIGGHILAHTANYRVYVRRGKAGTRVGRLVDAPDLPESECVFIINELGVRDPEEKGGK